MSFRHNPVSDQGTKLSNLPTAQKPKATYDASLGTIASIATLVSFAPTAEPASPNELCLMLSEVETALPTTASEDLTGLRFITLIAQHTYEPYFVYSDLTDEYDASEIEALHLESATRYGW